MGESCLFCEIRDGKIPAHRVYEDARTLAFLDVNPRAPGHTVIIPKYHSENILDLPEQELAALFRTVKKVAGRITHVLKADGLTIGINQGAVSGQTIRHLHVHVLPRFMGDGGGSVHSVVNNPSKESLTQIAKQIKID